MQPSVSTIIHLAFIFDVIRFPTPYAKDFLFGVFVTFCWAEKRYIIRDRIQQPFIPPSTPIQSTIMQTG